MAEGAAKAKGSVKYDWYQTEQAVVVNVLLKNVKEKDVEVQFERDEVSVQIPTEDVSLNLLLRGAIHLPPQSYWRVTPSKIEVRCIKENGSRWDKLEREPGEVVAPAESSEAHSSTTVATRGKWDVLAKELEKEEKDSLEGDAAVNALFQQIYAQGDEDTRRAMVKSFYESGGTVLSTNWGEVGKDKVEVKPPEGMEFKQWDS